MIERIFAGAAGTMALLLIATAGGEAAQKVVLVAWTWRQHIQHFMAWSN